MDKLTVPTNGRVNGKTNGTNGHKPIEDLKETEEERRPPPNLISDQVSMFKGEGHHGRDWYKFFLEGSDDPSHWLARTEYKNEQTIIEIAMILENNDAWNFGEIDPVQFEKVVAIGSMSLKRQSLRQVEHMVIGDREFQKRANDQGMAAQINDNYKRAEQQNKSPQQ